MLKNTTGGTPVISIVSSDGVRFVIPEQAAEYSVLLKSALERWALEYLSHPSTAINNDAEDDFDPNDDSDSSEETTQPLHESSLLGHSGIDSTSSGSSSVDQDSFVDANPQAECQALLVGHAPLHRVISKNGITVHKNTGVDCIICDKKNTMNTEKGSRDAATANVAHSSILKHEHEHLTAGQSTDLAACGNPSLSMQRGSSPRRMADSNEGSGARCGDDRWSYSSMPHGSVSSSTEVKLMEGQKDIMGRSIESDRRRRSPKKGHSPTVVVFEEDHADVGDTEPWFAPAPIEVLHPNLVNSSGKSYDSSDSNAKGRKTIHYDCQTFLANSTDLSNLSENKSSPQSERKSPASVHQRTPVMLEDDDKLIIMGNDGQQETLHSFERIPTSPATAFNEKSGVRINDSDYGVGVKNSYADSSFKSSNGSTSNAHRNEQPLTNSTDPKSLLVSATSDTAALASEAKNHLDTSTNSALDFEDMFEVARITANEILIDLCAASLKEESFANSSSVLAGDDPDSNAASLGRQTESQTASHFVHPLAYQGNTSSGITLPYGGAKESAVSGKKNAPHPPKISTKALQLCVDYLLHFVEVAEDATVYTHDDTPTSVPMPLPVPLSTLISAWERDFLYVRILGYDLTFVENISQKVLPDGINYLFLGKALLDPHVRSRLLMHPPPLEGLQLLMQVKKAASELRIDSLNELCVAWIADFMIRASYGSANNFDAACVIQDCFGIPNEWTRKEMDCLRIENDWPEREEEC